MSTGSLITQLVLNFLCSSLPWIICQQEFSMKWKCVAILIQKPFAALFSFRYSSRLVRCIEHELSNRSHHNYAMPHRPLKASSQIPYRTPFRPTFPQHTILHRLRRLPRYLINLKNITQLLIISLQCSVTRAMGPLLRGVGSDPD